MTQLPSTNWMGLASILLLGLVSGGGMKYLFDLVILRKHRDANVETLHIDTDAKRVQMADKIIAQFAERVQHLEENDKRKDVIIHRQNRRIARLERKLLLEGIELPEEEVYG